MRVQDSCRGGWLLSTVSVLILGDFKAASYESVHQWHKEQEWKVDSKSAHPVSFGFYSDGHRFESVRTPAAHSEDFKGFLSLPPNKTEVLFTLETIKFDISSACLLFILTL